MKDLKTYVNESINESLLGMIIKLFTNKLKVLQKSLAYQKILLMILVKNLQNNKINLIVN